MSPRTHKKLAQYIPGQNQGFPFFIVGIVVIGILALTGVFKSGGPNLSGKDGRDDVVAGIGGSVLSSTSSPACQKAGINLAGPFGHASTDNLIRANRLGMGWMLAIATEPGEATLVAERIRAASALGISTILRICYHDNCGFKEVDTYVAFLKDVASQTGGVTFYAIAGPNEPLNENWLPGTENIPVPIPSNDGQYDTIGNALAIYMNGVIDGVRADSSMNNVKLLSPIFNIGRFDFYDKLLPRIRLHNPNFAGLDGIAGNTYITEDGQMIKPEMDELKAAFPGMDLYITETGTFTRNFEQLVPEVKSAFIDDPQVKAYLFFNAFGTNASSDFERFVMSDEQLAYVIEGATGENCTEFEPDPNIEPDRGTPSNELISACPFDGDYSHDLESCQVLQTSETSPARGRCEKGTAVCGNLPITKCPGAEGCPAEAAGKWYGGYEITAHVEKIPTLRYLQAVTGSYTDDDILDDSVEEREIQSITPCFLRNVTNFYPDVDWSSKFDGRVGLKSPSNKDKSDAIVPFLGTAAGCLFYNQNDFYGGFNQIAEGFYVEGAQTGNTQGISTDSSGQVQGITDVISDIFAAIIGFFEKGVFSLSTPSQEQNANPPLCRAGGIDVTKVMDPAVSALNGADTIEISRAYETVIASEHNIMTDTELCDRQLTGDRDISGASCEINGTVFTDDPTIEVYDSNGNVLYVIDYQEEKEKNGGEVDSASGNPILKKDYKRVTEISLDGMKRALAGAYLDEALFFHGLGTRIGEIAVENNGYRVIHYKNPGIQVPMMLRIYDILDHLFPEGGGVIDPEKIAQCTEGIDFYGGEFGLAEGDKPRGHDTYIVPWIGQIPRMYGRISAVGTDYKITATGDIETLSNSLNTQGEQRLLNCNSPEYTNNSSLNGKEDCIVPWGDPLEDPLFSWLVDEGVLSEAEIAGTFGRAGLTEPDETPECTNYNVSSNYTCPVSRCDDGVIVDGGRYGDPRDYGEHEGVDFAIEDDDVTASASGVVIYAGDARVDTVSDPEGTKALGIFKGYGNVILIEHDPSPNNPNAIDYTLYAHLKDSSILVTKGDIVEQGQKIAVVGSTGLSTGPHLHFEIREGGIVWGTQGNCVDPLPLIGNPGGTNGQSGTCVDGEFRTRRGITTQMDEGFLDLLRTVGNSTCTPPGLLAAVVTKEIGGEPAFNQLTGDQFSIIDVPGNDIGPFQFTDIAWSTSDRPGYGRVSGLGFRGSNASYPYGTSQCLEVIDMWEESWLNTAFEEIPIRPEFWEDQTKGILNRKVLGHSACAASAKLKNDSRTSDTSCLDWTHQDVINAATAYLGDPDGTPCEQAGVEYCEAVWDLFCEYSQLDYSDLYSGTGGKPTECTAIESNRGGNTGLPGGSLMCNNDDEITIMPLGDSITSGFPCSRLAGYRKILANTMSANGYNVRLVGSIEDAAGSPHEHNGHAGYSPGQLLNGAEWAAGDCTPYSENYDDNNDGIRGDAAAGVFDIDNPGYPDIVLLLAGVNQLCTNFEGNLTDLEDIVDTIGSRSYIVLTTLTPTFTNTCHTTDPEHNFSEFNKRLRTLYASRRGQGEWQNVVLVDMENPANQANKLFATDFGDGLHPNGDGYQKMVNIWMEEGINPILAHCTTIDNSSGDNENPGNNDGNQVLGDTACPLQNVPDQWTNGPSHSLCEYRATYPNDYSAVDIPGPGNNPNTVVYSPVDGTVIRIVKPWENNYWWCEDDDNIPSAYDGGYVYEIKPDWSTDDIYRLVHLEPMLGIDVNEGDHIEAGAPVAKLFDGDVDESIPTGQCFNNYNEEVGDCFRSSHVHLHFNIRNGNAQNFIADTCGYSPVSSPSWTPQSPNNCCNENGNCNLQWQDEIDFSGRPSTCQ